MDQQVNMLAEQFKSLLLLYIIMGMAVPECATPAWGGINREEWGCP